MCFSVQASFSLAIALSAIGIFSLSKMKTKSIALFAAIPLFFACQQALEGVVWLTFNQSGSKEIFHQAAILGYLFFASMFWPIALPTSVYLLEKNELRKKMLLGILVIGIIFAMIYALNWSLVEISASIEDGHIVYPFLFDSFGPLNLPHIQLIHHGLWLMYCLCTMVVFFCSSVRWMWIIGIFVGLAYLIAQIFYQNAIGSVWCYFAAFLSLINCYIVIHHE